MSESPTTSKRLFSSVDVLTSSSSIDKPRRKRSRGSHYDVLTVLYKPGKTIFDAFKAGKRVKVFVPPEHLSPNKEFRIGLYSSDIDIELREKEKRLWGTDIYRDESDLIAACIHSEFVSRDQIRKNADCLKGMIVTVKIQKPIAKYTASLRNNIRSKNWISKGDTNGFIIESCKLLADKSKSINSFLEDNIQSKEIEKVANDIEYEYMPYLNDDAGKYRFLPNVTIVYNLANEPSLKYSLNSIADRGFNKKELTSYRLLTEVIYFETIDKRYEISYSKEEKKFRFAELKKNLNSLSVSSLKKGLPLDEENLCEVLFCEWSEIVWGASSVRIGTKKKIDDIMSIQFYKRTKEIVDDEGGQKEEHEEEGEESNAMEESKDETIEETNENQNKQEHTKVDTQMKE